MTESARSSQQSGDRPRWIDAADRVVLSLHRNGFLQSLIFHVALLLVLALTVIEPAAVTNAVRLALAFTAANDAPVDVQDVVMEPPELLEAVQPDLLAVDATIPDEALAAADQVQPAFESADVEVASLDGAVQLAGMNVDDLLAEVPGAIRMAAAGRATAGQRGDGLAVAGGGFGGELGRRLQAAGARTGDVQVSIAWDNFNDIDVHVMVESIAPRRGVSMINFSNRRGACGGWLDVDQNVVPMTPAAVENVFWAHGAAPYGRYTVFVHQYRNWGGPDPTRVRVAILVDGRQSHHEAVVHAHSGPVVVTSFMRQPGDPAVRAAAAADDASLAPAP